MKSLTPYGPLPLATDTPTFTTTGLDLAELSAFGSMSFQLSANATTNDHADFYGSNLATITGLDQTYALAGIPVEGESSRAPVPGGPPRFRYLYVNRTKGTTASVFLNVCGQESGAEAGGSLSDNLAFTFHRETNFSAGSPDAVTVLLQNTIRANITVSGLELWPHGMLIANDVNYVEISVLLCDLDGNILSALLSVNTKTSGAGGTGDWSFGHVAFPGPFTLGTSRQLRVILTQRGAGVDTPPFDLLPY